MGDTMTEDQRLTADLADRLAAVTAERDRLLAENERLKQAADAAAREQRDE